MPYLASGYSSVTAAARRCAVECRRTCKGSSLDSCSPYSAMGSSSIWTPCLHFRPSLRARHSRVTPLSPTLPLSGGRASKQMDTGAILDALGYLAAGLGSLIEGAGIAFPGQVILLAAAAWAAARHGSLALVSLIGVA